MAYWLVKSEPFKYSWEDFVKQGTGMWDGVRNYQARNNLKSMKLNDLVFFYHSNEGKEIVGLAKVAREFYQDPTTDNPNWVAVDLQPVEKFPQTVTLAQLKTDPRLENLALVRHSRLSVTPVRDEEFDLILALAYGKD
ncbi:MAG: EVE domain-containing protein [Spirosomataceae bacterium]